MPCHICTTNLHQCPAMDDIYIYSRVRAVLEYVGRQVRTEVYTLTIIQVDGNFMLQLLFNSLYVYCSLTRIIAGHVCITLLPWLIMLLILLVYSFCIYMNVIEIPQKTEKKNNNFYHIETTVIRSLVNKRTMLFY